MIFQHIIALNSKERKNFVGILHRNGYIGLMCMYRCEIDVAYAQNQFDFNGGKITALIYMFEKKNIVKKGL